jgi:ABC-2 type transport system ATP-binding protein
VDVLEVRSVSRSFDGVMALKDVSFEVTPGRMTGFVGANGSGKTTTMRIVLGVLGAHGGSVHWRGAPVTQPVRQRFGYMPEERGLYPKMRVAEQLVFFGRLHGLASDVARRNTAELIQRLDLTERADDPVEKLSLGNQQRVQICAALIHEPQLLILDEPFSGLDPLAIDTVLKVLRDSAERGAAVLFSSHQLELVERLCDDVVIISKGSIAAAGEREALRRQFRSPRWELVVDGDAGWVRDMPGIEVTELDGARVVFEAGDAQTVVREAVRRGPIHVFRPVVPSLAEIFREVV